MTALSRSSVFRERWLQMCTIILTHFFLFLVLWDPLTNQETRLQNMPGNFVRVYPALGATVMLPLTPQNNYSQTDDDMLDARSMGQFIALPDRTLLVVNGGRNGTSGYAQATGQTPSFKGMTLPLVAGLQASTIARLYHSSAILLLDVSVLIAGSNPNVDVNTSMIFPTTYAEIFYPPYFGSMRPVPTGVPTTLTYGGSYSNVTIPASSYNDAVANTTVWVMRRASRHAMNMGRRAMALNSTYTVNQDGSFVLHVSQPPPNPNLLQPGPVFIHVTVKGIPSDGAYAIVGSGDFGTQLTQGIQTLLNPVRLDSATSHTGAIIGGIVGAVVVIGAIGAIVGICMKSRKRNNAQTARNVGGHGGGAPGMMRKRDSDATMMPLQDSNWAASSADLRAPSPYKDYGGRATPSCEFDLYIHQPMGQPGY
ncbi:hypothetical protein DFH11DRAFT_1815615 [Phellopilus nigrolimitatus]|nr:hypothetical protein DFH11DRAFT_1815615 [Phellopilus nigrolimitatus]